MAADRLSMAGIAVPAGVGVIHGACESGMATAWIEQRVDLERIPRGRAGGEPVFRRSTATTSRFVPRRSGGTSADPRLACAGSDSCGQRDGPRARTARLSASFSSEKVVNTPCRRATAQAEQCPNPHKDVPRHRQQRPVRGSPPSRLRATPHDPRLSAEYQD